MIILPDRHIPRARLLLPVSDREWRKPSQRRQTYGIEDQTRFRLTARLNDGHIVWRGWFDDRDAADTFMLAIALGNLTQDPGLWRLPTPQWHPGMGESLAYEFATVVFLTGTSGSNQTYTIPSDWGSSANTIETIGAGGSGAAGFASNSAGGGAGGAYSKITNLTLTPGGSATYFLPAGAAASGNAGGDCWFNGSTLAGSSVGAKGGGGGSSGSGGTGGASASGVGTTKNSGGNGGTNGSSYSAGGGGGAGGPNGVGAAGGNGGGTSQGGGGGGGNGGGSAGTTPSSSSGGAGGNNSSSSGSGAGSTSNGTAGTAGTAGGGGGGGFYNPGTSAGNTGGAGGPGTEFDSTHGSGGGGGGLVRRTFRRITALAGRMVAVAVVGHTTGRLVRQAAKV